MKEVRLRAMEPEDLELLYRIENDRELWDVGATNVPYSRFHLRNYIATSQANIYADEELRMVVETDEGAVGLIDLINFDPRHRRAEVGVVVMKNQRRKGIAEQALNQLADHACRVLHIHQLYAFVAADNSASLALFEKCGYKTSVRLGDWLYDGQAYKDAILVTKLLSL